MFHSLFHKFPRARFVMPIVLYLVTVLLFYGHSLLQQTFHLQNSWTGLVISYVLFILIIGLLVYYLINSGETQSFTTFPISLQNIILFAILLGCSVWVGRFLSQNLPTPVNHIQNLQAREQVQSMSSALIFAKMFGMVFIVIWEELIFRGLVMKTYFKDSPYGWDIFLSIILFTCLHLQVSSAYTDFIIYTCIAWPIPVLYRKTGSIYYPILFHLLYNLL